ncbi:MAG: hypothetical protein O7A07_04400 [Acidobacteria bacterium]|nr:hypothetical protein [Acidobacteriota bacterium]
MNLTETGRAGGGLFRPGQGGWSLAELLAAMAITAMAMSLCLPPTFTWARRQRLQGAIRRLAQDLQASRWRALATGRATGLVFTVAAGGDLRWTIYHDGDGDGLRRADVESGVDISLGRVRQLSQVAPGVRAGLLMGTFSAGVPRLPPQSGWITNPEDPVKFGASDMASFSPQGSATSGSLYLTDGHDMAALVINGITGRLRLFRFDLTGRDWKEMN